MRFRSVFLKAAAVAAVLGVGVAAPWDAGAETPARITYAGTVKIDNSNDGKSDPVAMPLSIVVQGSEIVTFEFPGTLRCTDGGFKNWSVESPGVGMQPGPFPVSDDRFDFSVGSLQSPDRVAGHLTGTITPGDEVVGKIHIEAYQNPAPGTTGSLCNASYNWVAKATVPPQPSAHATFLPVALPNGKSGYSYGIVLTSLDCETGALDVKITIPGHATTTLQCNAVSEVGAVVVATNVYAGASYVIATQPIALVSGRLTAKGAKQTITMRIPRLTSTDITAPN